MIRSKISDLAGNGISLEVCSCPSQYILTVYNNCGIGCEVLASDVERYSSNAIHLTLTNRWSIRIRRAIVRREKAHRNVLGNGCRRAPFWFRYPVQFELTAGGALLPVNHDVIGMRRVVIEGYRAGRIGGRNVVAAG